MKKSSWQVKFGIALIGLSIALYLVHYLIFQDSHHIFIYLLGDIAFVPIEVLLVTLILHRLLSAREKRLLIEKLNMIIGAFYSEAGIKLLEGFSDADPRLALIKNELIPENDWDSSEFHTAKKRLIGYDYNIEVNKINIGDLKDFLGNKRDFLLRLLENPNLLEHETFTELLRAVFHLTEELSLRSEKFDLAKLEEADLEHLRIDICRAYSLLVKEWFDYMQYLQAEYPYMFALAMRTNPFDEKASILVTGR